MYNPLTTSGFPFTNLCVFGVMEVDTKTKQLKEQRPEPQGTGRLT